MLGIESWGRSVFTQKPPLTHSVSTPDQKSSEIPRKSFIWYSIKILLNLQNYLLVQKFYEKILGFQIFGNNNILINISEDMESRLWYCKSFTILIYM